MSDRRPSTYDIARLAGVSRSTVSFVLNGRKDIWIADETRERVFAIAKQLNYRPNQLARALITGTSRLVGLWMWSMSTPFNASIIEQSLKLMHADGYQALFFEMSSLGDAPDLPDPGQWPLDGIIAEGDPAFLKAYVDRHDLTTPIVTIGVRTSPATDQVNFDISIGVGEALRHFVDTGRTRIAFLLPNNIALDSDEERLACYRQFMSEIDEAPVYIRCDFSARSRTAVMDEIAAHVEAYGCPQAILCYNDEMAIAANRVLRERGLRVPDDVNLVGCDNWVETEFQVPQLSTISIPVNEGCSTAWEFLRNRIANPDIPTQTAKLPAHLIRRGSTS